MPDKRKLPDKEETKQETVTEATKQDKKEVVAETKPIVEITKQDKKETKESAPRGVRTQREFDSSSWSPKTELGRAVKSGKIKDISEIFDGHVRIMEAEIVDMLVPNLESDLLMIGQSKGKFGGGKRSIWKQTQKKTMEGNKPKFSTLVVVGNRDGYVGIGKGKAKETMPAREKATRNSKLSLINIRRGCGAWACGCKEPHTIPFKVRGKCGSVVLELIPAPKGSGLKAERECRKVLELAGIKDIYSKSFGHTKTKLNLIKACFIALSELSKTKVTEAALKNLGVVKGMNDGK